MTQVPFHLAIPVTDLAAARRFYTEMFGCAVGRVAERWIDFNFFGHQLTVHLADEQLDPRTNSVDGEAVPVRHFGAILRWKDWHELAERLDSKGAAFLIKPCIRFGGQVGEQATMFVVDPSGNAIELKSFKDPGRIFAAESDIAARAL